MTATRKGRQQRGTTLIEQVMVLAIFAILLSVAVPSLGTLLRRNRVQVAQTDFIAFLRHARETAAYSGKRTVLCPSEDGLACSDQERWDHGWLLANDLDHDDQPDTAPLRVGAGYQQKVIIRSSPGRHIVRFRPDGSAGGSNLTVLFCDPSGKNPALTVVVANSGRIRGAPGTADQSASCLPAEE